MTSNDNASAVDELDLEQVEAFAEKVATDQAIASNAVLAYLGDRLGLWRTLAEADAVTSDELAGRTGLAERYLREWLAAQAAAGYLSYEPRTRRFHLTPEHAAVLADDDSPAALAGGFEFNAAIWATVDRLAHAYTTGDGIGWHEQDARLFSAVERFFRPLYRTSLVEAWLPAVDGLVDRLRRGIHVLDVGCGLGTATLLIGQAFPASTVLGVDNHDESIRRASRAAEQAEAQSNVTFAQADAHQYGGGPFDLICFFDTLHDLGDPLGALQHARSALAPDGVVLVVEPAAADILEDNLHPLGLSWYASSAAVCLPGSLSQPGHAGLGAQAGPRRLLEVLTQAGFSVAQQVAATPFNLVFEARH